MKPLKEKLPIEPLSEPRWKRVDDSLFASLDAESDHAAESARNDEASRSPERSSRRTTLYVLSALAVAAVVFALVLRTVLAPTHGDLALNPSHIETGAAPSRYGVGESTVEIGPHSAIVASGDAEHGVLVVLEKGSVDCEVAPRNGRPAFVVQAGDVRVRVVGTRFSVKRTDKDVRVKVVHGAVEVSGASQIVLLHDGDEWPGESTLAPIAPSTAPSTTSSATAMIEPDSSALVLPSAQPTPSAPAVSNIKNDQRAYESAAKVESSDPDAAMTAYKRISSSGGAWAPTALFAAGRLAFDRGRTAEAKKYLQMYVARYPNGTNVDDAKRILSRID